MPDGGRSYDCYEILFPEKRDRPNTGYVEWGIRNSVSFDDKIEIFDATAEFATAEGLLRYRAQELENDRRSLEIIQEGVDGYIKAFDELSLWNPKASSDIVAGLNDLFQERDWTPFVSQAALRVPEVTIRNLQLLPYDENLALVRFDYFNGENVGREMEYVKRGSRPKIVRHGWSALRSAVPAFSGRQLNTVYDALQNALDVRSEPLESC